jgi:hypothetical protein
MHVCARFLFMRPMTLMRNKSIHCVVVTATQATQGRQSHLSMRWPHAQSLMRVLMPTQTSLKESEDVDRPMCTCAFWYINPFYVKYALETGDGSSITCLIISSRNYGIRRSSGRRRAWRSLEPMLIVLARGISSSGQ